MEKYGHEVILCGSKPDLIPLVFEHFGHWTSQRNYFFKNWQRSPNLLGMPSLRPNSLQTGEDNYLFYYRIATAK